MTKNMHDVIKAQNGERFAKAIRNYDNGIFDIPNIDKIVKYAGRDAEPIMQYLVSLKGIKIQADLIDFQGNTPTKFRYLHLMAFKRLSVFIQQ